MYHAILLACDPGERLRPLTDAETPTALLALGSRQTLLQQSIARLETLIPQANIWIIAAPNHRTSVLEAAGEAVHIVESGAASPSEAIRAALVELRGLSESDDAAAVLLQSAAEVFSPGAGYEEHLAIALHYVAANRAPLALTVMDESGSQACTGIQVWPALQLLELLESGAFPEAVSTDRLLASFEEGLNTRAFHDDGWVHVSDWPDVQRLLAYVEKPWGYERLWALNRHYAGKVLFIRAGESLSLQYHRTKDETIRISSGRMRFRAGPRPDAMESFLLEPGMTYAIPPGLVHQMEALDDCTVIEVSTPHLTDVVRLEDRYGRS